MSSFGIDDLWSIKCHQHFGSWSKVIQRSGGVCLSQQMGNEMPNISESCLRQQGFTGTPKRTEQNLILCSGKCEAELTNNKRLHSRYCIVEANY